MIVRMMISSILLAGPAFADSPEWIHESQRQVVGGDILHWGTGDGESQELALFKARHMAIKAIVEECGGIASKHIVPRRQHVEPSFKGYRAFARVSIEFDACEYGKSARGRKDAGAENPKIAEGQKLYDELIRYQALPPEKKEPARVEAIEAKIRKIVNSENDYVARKLDRLEGDIQRVERIAEERRPVVVQPVKLPATSSQKIMCQEEVRQMANELNMISAPYNGDLTEPEVAPHYSRLMQKRMLCARLK